jgi:hypothetical protein
LKVANAIDIESAGSAPLLLNDVGGSSLIKRKVDNNNNTTSSVIINKKKRTVPELAEFVFQQFEFGFEKIHEEWIVLSAKEKKELKQNIIKKLDKLLH